MDKIRRIFPLLILFTLLSCADTIETRIPYRAVYLELDLTYQDKALNAIQAYKIYVLDLRRKYARLSLSH